LRRLAGVLPILLIAAATLAGCSPVLETDQARLCRMALPALIPQEARIAILTQAPDADGRGLRVAFTAETSSGERQTHRAACRFRLPGRPHESRDLTSLTLDGQPLSETQLFFLIR
jgi:branched-chain amino acid transport system permease protein